MTTRPTATRALVVDDASIFRRIVTDALAALPNVEVVGTAANGKVALTKIDALRPDVITLDIEMPEMNGLEVLEAMRAGRMPGTVIVLSSQTVRGGAMTVRALEAGAFDFITKPEAGRPEDNLRRLREGLGPIIHALERRREIREILGSKSPRTNPVLPADMPMGSKVRQGSRRGPPIVLVGVSTGGPTALAQMLPALPAKLGAPVFIVQHMPPLFTAALAERLNGKCAIPVKEAEDGETASVNCAYLAPGGKQMKLVPGQHGEIVIRTTDDPAELSCRPSVNYLFRSAALHFPGRSIAAVLTGMGNDGTEGIRMLKKTGSLTIAQDEASCVVFGMPKEAILSGAIDIVVPLSRIADAIIRGVAEVVQ